MVANNLASMFDPPSVDSIISAFRRVSSPADGADPRNAGCLMVNTVFEIDEPAEDVASEITQYRDIWRPTFSRALESDGVTEAEVRTEFLVGASGAH